MSGQEFVEFVHRGKSQGLSHEEIAQKLDITVNELKAAYSYCSTRIQAKK